MIHTSPSTLNPSIINSNKIIIFLKDNTYSLPVIAHKEAFP
jgi:hypothetical protein